MVEKYKREGIDIVLDSKKCIYTDEKNKKFIKQNKKYFPIVKRKGKYVIINIKGGGQEIDDLKINLENLKNQLAENKKDKKSFADELNKKAKNIGFFTNTGEIKRLSDNSIQAVKNILNINHLINIGKNKLKELEGKEEWDKISPNPGKEDFLKEIAEKEKLIKSLQENYTEYIKKIDREDIYLAIYIKEKENDINLDFISEEFYPFLLENLLKRIIDLEKRINS